MKVAYIMSRFPRITETFVLHEILAIRERGFEVAIYPLILERPKREHPEVARVRGAIRHHPFLSPGVLRANLRRLLGDPRRYLGTLGAIIRHTWRSPNFLFGGLAIFPKSVLLAEEMRARGIDHVHAHFANHPALSAWIVRRLSGIPYSFTAHGSDIHVDQTGFAWKARSASFAVMVSRYNRDFLVGRCGEDIAAKMRIIHSGIDPRCFEAVPARREPGPLRILCVASFRAVKGHRHLVGACGILRRRGIPFRCHLVGGGPLRRRIRAQVERAGLADAFEFHGPLARPGVLERMREADVVALTSVEDRKGRREGIPVSLMEAMASGLPVVSSRLSGIPELVEPGRTGFLVPPGDDRAIAEALEELARSPDLRERLGRAGREKVSEEFDLGASAARLGDLFLDQARSDRGPITSAGRSPGRPEGSCRPDPERP